MNKHMVEGTQFLVFLISPEKSKTCEVNQQSVLNLKTLHRFPKIPDRTITFNTFTFKNTKIEPQNYIIIFIGTNNLESVDK